MKVNRKISETMRAARAVKKMICPAMERELGVDLSGVKIKPFECLIEDACDDHKSLISRVVKMPLNWIDAVLTLYWDKRKAYAFHWIDKNTTYIRVQHMSLDGKMLPVQRLFEQPKYVPPIEQVITHEFGHAAFSKMKPTSCERTELESFWDEGFAHYLEEVHFRHLYGYTELGEVSRASVRGKAKSSVAKLVQERGPQFLREIPKVYRGLAIQP
jgi:hypothetical protein